MVSAKEQHGLHMKQQAKQHSSERESAIIITRRWPLVDLLRVAIPSDPRPAVGARRRAAQPASDDAPGVGAHSALARADPEV